MCVHNELPLPLFSLPDASAMSSNAQLFALRSAICYAFEKYEQDKMYVHNELPSPSNIMTLFSLSHDV